MSSRKLWQLMFGLALVVLLLVGCGGAKAEPTATPTSAPSTATPTLVAGYDGSWLGTTDQGQFIEFQIENNSVRSINIGFAIPGCERDSPVGFYFGTPEHFITDSSLDITLKGSYAINIKATFISASSVSGSLEITPPNRCGQGLSANWSAVPAEAFEPPPLPPELIARIPDVEIPDELLLPEVGATNFNAFTRVLGQQGDWFLVTTFDSIYPIPSGWTTSGTGKEDAILTFSKGGIQKIVITVGASAGQYQTSEEVISELEDAISQAPNVSLINRQVVDAKKAYIFSQTEAESGIKRYTLIVLSQDPEGWFRTLYAIADVQDWNDYYPIIRAIVENWALRWDNSTLGVALPETLVE